jgi:signal transduction histidine kinase
VVIAAMFGWLAVAWLIAADEMPAGGPPGATGELPPLLSGIVNQILVNVLVFGFAYFFGETAWLAARREHALAEQAAELRTARAAAEERAVFAERVRIARELHDVVAHHVSVMGVQAGAARVVLDHDPAQTRGALTRIETGARSALEEMHRLLGVLRDPDAGAVPSDGDAEPPPPGLDAVPALVEQARSAGLRVECTVVGDPLPVPESIGLSAYRIMQEALTNTLRHAAATRVDVRVRYLPGSLEVEVVDDGRGTSASPSTQPSTRTGLGLAGMRERVAVHDGELEVGPRPGGGYRVRARFPLAGASAPVAERSQEPVG